MADPSNDEKFDKGKEKQEIRGQPIGGNDTATGSGTPLSQGAEFGGGAATDHVQLGSGSEPPRSMGTRGSEFGQFGDATGPAGQQGQSGTGQADLGSQAGSTLAGHTDQQELGNIGGDVDQPASYGGDIEVRHSNTEGEGFILQQENSADDAERTKSGSSAKATGGSDFAREGQGAAEDRDEADEDDSA